MDQSAQAKTERPADIDEEFWNAEKGEVKAIELAAALRADRTKLGELQSRFATVPEKPEAYEATIDQVKAFLPADLALPEGTELLPNDDPVMVGAKKLAHELGVPAADFPKMVAFEVTRQIREANEVIAEAGKQRAALGEKGPARIEAVETWLKGRLGESAEFLFPLIARREQVEAFETLIKGFGNGAAPFTPQGRTLETKPDLTGTTGAERIHLARQCGAKN